MTAKSVEDTQPPADTFASATEVADLKQRIAALEATIRVMAERAMPPVIADDVVQSAETLHAGRVRARMISAGVVPESAEAMETVVSARMKALRTIIHFPQITLPQSLERAIRRLFD